MGKTEVSLKYDQSMYGKPKCAMFTAKPPFVNQRGLSTNKRRFKPRTEGLQNLSVRILPNLTKRFV
jgi:hypothetical protein